MHRLKLALLIRATIALVLALVAAQAHAQTLTTIASFTGAEGSKPEGSLTLSADGSTFYGMTETGGANNDGAIFSIPVAGGSPTILASLDGADGANPWGSLTLSADGTTLYGMSYGGGAKNEGAIFSIAVTGGAPTVLASLSTSAGFDAYGSLTLSADGSTLYGMTQNGGPYNTGVVFSIPATGGALTTLSSFSFSPTAPQQPQGSLDLIGNTLYGLTADGGADKTGAVFSISAAGGPITTLGSFTDNYPSWPDGNLTLVGSTFYGLARLGGANDDGVIFSMPMSGGPITYLASFDGANGAYPFGSLTLVGSTLYGMTQSGGAYGDGVIFSIPVTGGTPTTLISFDGTNGEAPQRNDLTLVGSNLYGMTPSGGAYGDGTIFVLSTPEPSSVVLLGLGVLGLGAMALRGRLRRQPA